MKLTPLKTLAAAGALILLANVVALTGVYFNRSGEPEARMKLSQRELGTPWDWSAVGDNSGLVLGLNWRVNDGHAGEKFYADYGYHGGTPEWLDEPRMKALGFDTAPVGESGEARRRFERSLPREVLLVLELAGPAWQQARQRAWQNAARHEAARLANADSKEFAGKAKQAQDALQSEETRNSRLFAIDAGLDRAALRAKYPDRSRFLILKAKLRPTLATQDKKTRVSAHVSELAVRRINVPHALRPGLEPALRNPRSNGRDPDAKFEATVAFGQRLEPWIEAISVSR
jgi:hypothetical protein